MPIWISSITGLFFLFGCYGIWRHRHPPNYPMPPLIGFWIVAVAYGLMLLACLAIGAIRAWINPDWVLLSSLGGMFVSEQQEQEGKKEPA